MDIGTGGEVMRIGLVSTDSLRVLGVESILSREEGFEVVRLTGAGALDTIELEVVLIDASATNHLLELMDTFRRNRPALRLIVMGSEDGLAYMERVIGAGAKGYLSHSASEAELRMAVSVVRDGSVWAPRKVLSRLLDRAQPGALRSGPEPEVRLTEREMEVLKLLAQGHPNRGIGVRLGIDEGTVKAHVGSSCARWVYGIGPH